MNIFKKNINWALPVLILLLLTPFSAATDLFVAKFIFYRGAPEPVAASSGFFSTSFFDFIYLYGVLPAQLACGGALITLVLSIWIEKLKPYRKICIVLSLTLCIGSGLITHSVLKECWGRPRPRQITEFGGSQSFRAYYQPLFGKAPEPSKSFPSGHSTCGFYFFSVYFLAKRHRRTGLARSAFAFSLVLGGMLSAARLVQGGHFISDVFIAAIIMWLTAYFVDHMVYETKLFRRSKNSCQAS